MLCGNLNGKETQIQKSYMYMYWRWKWQPTSVFLPGKSHGQRKLAHYSPWGCKRVGHDLQLHNNNNQSTETQVTVTKI